MKWKCKVEPPKPKLYDTKIVIHFAWKPTQVNNHMIWLCRYRSLYKYIYHEDGFEPDEDDLIHFPGLFRWIEVERDFL